jgi:GTP cyclohydrolase I
MVTAMVDRLDAEDGHIELSFPYFVTKLAPVSGMPSTLDYEVTFVGEKIDGRIDTWVKVLVGATSLCPCSKAISEYGAHNQRSHITMNVKVDGGMWLEDLIEIAEQEASCELWGVLKREDEKYVTERAYENPKFVEDLVRDVAARLTADPRVRAYSVESENFESIHNHSAYARIDVDKDA